MSTSLRSPDSRLRREVEPTSPIWVIAMIATIWAIVSSIGWYGAVQPPVLATTNTVAKFVSAGAVGNSSATDDGTTFAIATNKLTVTEASGNTSIAGTLGVTGLLTATAGINASGGTTTVGQIVGTVQTDTSTGTTTDFALN